MLGALFGLVALSNQACAKSWELHRNSQQSISGPQPFARIRSLGEPSTYDLVIECAPDGLQLAFGGRFPESGATLQFDDAPPISLPTRISLRGVPVIELRAPIAGRATTVEQLLVDASRLSVPSGTGQEPVVFDVSGSDRAIRALRCQRPGARSGARSGSGR